MVWVVIAYRLCTFTFCAICWPPQIPSSCQLLLVLEQDFLAFKDFCFVLFPPFYFLCASLRQFFIVSFQCLRDVCSASDLWAVLTVAHGFLQSSNRIHLTISNQNKMDREALGNTGECLLPSTMHKASDKRWQMGTMKIASPQLWEKKTGIWWAASSVE